MGRKRGSDLIITYPGQKKTEPKKFSEEVKRHNRTLSINERIIEKKEHEASLKEVWDE